MRDCLKLWPQNEKRFIKPAGIPTLPSPHIYIAGILPIGSLIEPHHTPPFQLFLTQKGTVPACHFRKPLQMEMQTDKKNHTSRKKYLFPAIRSDPKTERELSSLLESIETRP